MRQTVLSTLAFVVAAIVTSCNHSPSLSLSHAPSSNAPVVANNQQAWRVECDALCGLKSQAASLAELCEKTSLDAERLTQQPFTCADNKVIGLQAPPGAALRDAAMFSITGKKQRDRYMILAVHSQRGWHTARVLAHGHQEKEATGSIESGNLVDVPGLQPPAVEIRFTFNHNNTSSNRLFFCGIQNEGNIHCPLAATVGEKKKATGLSAITGSIGAMATIGDAKEWNVRVEVTPQGFVAHPSQGSVPESHASLVGEHTFANAEQEHN